MYDLLYNPLRCLLFLAVVLLALARPALADTTPTTQQFSAFTSGSSYGVDHGLWFTAIRAGNTVLIRNDSMWAAGSNHVSVVVGGVPQTDISWTTANGGSAQSSYDIPNTYWGRDCPVSIQYCGTKDVGLPASKGITIEIKNHASNNLVYNGVITLYMPNPTGGFDEGTSTGPESDGSYTINEDHLPLVPTAAYYVRRRVDGTTRTQDDTTWIPFSSSQCTVDYPTFILTVNNASDPDPVIPLPPPTPNPVNNPNPDPFPHSTTTNPPPPPLPAPPPPPNPLIPPPVPVTPKTINDPAIVDAIDNLNKQQAERAAKQLEEDNKNSQAILDALKGSGINTGGDSSGGNGGAAAAKAANDVSALFPHATPPAHFTHGEKPVFLVSFPAAFGGHFFDVNPFSNDRFAYICSWHRRACEWLAVIMFGIWASKEAAQYVRGVHSAPQAKGNTIVAGTGGQATSLIAAAAITAVVLTSLVALLAFTTTNLGAGTLLAQLGVDPMDGLLGGSAWMLDQLYPLGAIVAYFGGRLLWHFAAGSAYAIAAGFIRFIVP